MMARMETLTSQHAYTGVRVSVRRDTLLTAGGGERPIDVVVHPGGVVVIAEDRGEMLLVRQHRHPVGETLLELPAGTREPGEDPMETARRELQEEAGFRAGRLTKIAEFYTAPGFSTELLLLYVAEELVPAPLPRDEGEEIAVVRVPCAEAVAMARHGELRDAKTIIGLLLYGEQPRGA
jgi:ADP-ribose pyrophosphatase